MGVANKKLQQLVHHPLQLVATIMMKMAMMMKISDEKEAKEDSSSSGPSDDYNRDTATGSAASGATGSSTGSATGSSASGATGDDSNSNRKVKKVSTKQSKVDTELKEANKELIGLEKKLKMPVEKANKEPTSEDDKKSGL